MYIYIINGIDMLYPDNNGVLMFYKTDMIHHESYNHILSYEWCMCIYIHIHMAISYLFCGQKCRIMNGKLQH